MTKAQPQYLIIANRLCKTHKRGTIIVYTGPLIGIPYGWSNLGRVNTEQWAMRGNQ